MKKPNSETHQACRSLLQKAVRRGDTLLIRTLAQHLYEVGDSDWLKTRTSIITFEECWPLGRNLGKVSDFQSSLQMLLEVGLSVKVKDAAALGVLAYALSENDQSVLIGDTEDLDIQEVCEAIKDSSNFWDSVIQHSLTTEQQLLTNAALKAYRRGGWPWDRALIQAAAYLALKKDIPQVCVTKQASENVPIWVGLDKHTPQGKKALSEVANQIKISPRQLSWISFYLESTQFNESTESYWWSREVNWRLSQIGLNYDKARLIWDKASPLIEQTLREEIEILQTHFVQINTNNFLIENAELGTQQAQLPGF